MEKAKFNITKDREDLMEEKSEKIDNIKSVLVEMFGQEKLPKEIVQELIDVRQEIKKQVEIHEYYQEENAQEFDKKIANIVSLVSRHGEDFSNIENVYKNELGDIFIKREGEEAEILEDNERELFESFGLYFESYRQTRNAHKFRSNVKEAEEKIITENEKRVLNFYSEDEKNNAILNELKIKYEKAGFTDKELEELISFAKLEKLNQIEIHEIKTWGKIKEVFKKHLGGDGSKYITLSASLLLPAFINGYAPIQLANAFGGDKIEMLNILNFSLLSISATGMNVGIQKIFKDFINKNFNKDSGFNEYISENISSLPAEDISQTGEDRIKKRALNGRAGYEQILKDFSYDILPSGVMLGTSMAMLLQKDPKLALGTGLSAGAMMIFDKYFHKKGNFWQKEKESEAKMEEVIGKLNEQLSAHMEIILSGEKDEFTKKIKHLLDQERIADSDKKFLKELMNNFGNFYGALNLISASVATYFAGGTPDKFIAALSYQGRFTDGINRILRTKRNLFSSIRNIMQMEIMFNGYADEESKNEKERIGVSEIQGNDISLKDVSMMSGKKTILDNINLDIPGGSMTSLTGVSGAGKTTLMKIIAGYYKPTSGEIEYGGVDMGNIKKSGDDAMYKKIAYLSQFPYILNDTLKNNLCFGLKKDITEEEIKKVIEDVGLSERFKDINEQIRSGSGDKGTTSGGETQRIGLARVLLRIRNNNSNILFLDEPTASVDKETSNQIADIINKEKEKRPEVTFVVISHDKDFVKKLSCNIEIKMKEGRVVDKKNENN